jgi:predicted dehydrogenase
MSSAGQRRRREEEEMAHPQLGVIGTGWWATQFHLPAMVASGALEVGALADTDSAKLATAAERFGIERTFADPHEMLTSGLVDGVVIAVPHVFHYEYAKAALEAGVHVFVEKPMVLTADHAWDLVRMADERDLHLTVGYTYHYTRAAEKVRETIGSGAIGEVIHVAGLFASMVESYYRGEPDEYRAVFDFPVTGPNAATYSDPAISGGGQAVTQITHGMGMVLWATGHRVTEVSAYMANRDLKVDLVDAIAYRLDNGAIGTMAATGSLTPGQPQQQEFRYYGTEGFILQDLLAGTVAIHRNDGTSEELEPLDADEVFPSSLPSARFAELIAGTGRNVAPGEVGARVVEFLEAAYRSVEIGGPVRPDDLVGAPPSSSA